MADLEDDNLDDENDSSDDNLENNKDKKDDDNKDADNLDNNEMINITYLATKETKKIKIEQIEQAYNLFISALKYEEEELREKKHCWVMGIDSAGYVSCVYTVLFGSSDLTVLTPAEIFQYAIARGCTSVILAHNRPEGISLEPTEHDFDVTNFLYHCVRYMNIEVLDHLIINLNTFISLYKNKKMIKIIESIKYKPYSEIKHIIDKRIKKALNDGRREGIVAGKFLGREEGLIEGEQIGIDKGEKNKTIEIIKSMLNKNMDVNLISDLTDTCLENIETIRKNM